MDIKKVLAAKNLYRERLSVVFTPPYKTKFSPLLILHATVSGNFDNTLAWLTRNDAQVSAHYLVGNNDPVVEMVPVQYAAYHAGVSKWKYPNSEVYSQVRNSVNDFSIGIEILNWQKLTKKGDDFYTHYGQLFKGTVASKMENDGSLSYWEPFKDYQYDAVAKLFFHINNELVKLERDPIKEEDILRHSDVSPNRKTDPGPAWDMGKLLAKIQQLKGTL